VLLYGSNVLETHAYICLAAMLDQHNLGRAASSEASISVNARAIY
jgi:hypothetical protein